MMLTNEPLMAEQAVEWGFVSECVDDDDLMAAAGDLATKLAKGPTRALAETRAMVDAAEENSFETQFRRELEVNSELRVSYDAQEGVAAFLEKRQAAFRGE
jgi:2-(1,2-epoxy-1,2-dihydrophenyl)acetyl-CoA isomerase